VRVGTAFMLVRERYSKFERGEGHLSPLSLPDITTLPGATAGRESCYGGEGRKGIHRSAVLVQCLSIGQELTEYSLSHKPRRARSWGTVN
jgi:hypothetical protein